MGRAFFVLEAIHDEVAINSSIGERAGSMLRTGLIWLLGLPASAFAGAVVGSYSDINGGSGDMAGAITGILAFCCIRIMQRLPAVR
jgi:hypothetical protein